MSYKKDDDFRAPNGHIRSGWNTAALLRGKYLDDRAIAKYQRLGYYDPAFRAARKEMWERRAAKRTQRQGNFDIIDGRQIYRPL